jgi:hypothetical protein
VKYVTSAWTAIGLNPIIVPPLIHRTWSGRPGRRNHPGLPVKALDEVVGLGGAPMDGQEVPARDGLLRNYLPFFPQL